LEIAIILAILAGLTLAFGGLQITYVSKNYPRMSQFQLTFDSLLVYSLILTPFFIYEMTQDEPVYDT
jgi:hypothetical protein